MSKENAVNKLSEVKTCPICGAMLEHGTTVAPRGIYWNKYSILNGTAIISQWRKTKAPGLRCNNCNIVILKAEP